VGPGAYTGGPASCGEGVCGVGLGWTDMGRSSG